MDNLLWLAQRVSRYGEILEDKRQVDRTGTWRATTYLYEDVKFLVLMHNGKLVGIW